MDIYVQKKLKRWSCARYIGIFRENGVSKNNFHLLTYDAIAGLIPNKVPRKAFLKKFKKLKMIRGIENTEVPTMSSSPELQKSSSASHTSQRSASLRKTDLIALLMKNRAGQRILNALQSGKPPTNFLRRRLIVFLIDNLLQSCDNNLSSEQKAELAKEIVEEFPHIYIQKECEVSENEQLEFQKESEENINIENQMQIEIEPPSLPALEFYSSDSMNETSEYSRCQNADGTYNEVKNDISLGTNISSYQDVTSDTMPSGTFALICCDEPIIKKEPGLSYDNIATTELPAPTEMTSVDYSKAATSSQGIIRDKDKFMVTDKKKFKKTEMQKAQEEVLNELNEIWKDMSSFYCHEDSDLQKTHASDGQKTSLRGPGTTVSESDFGSTDSTVSYDDYIVSKDEEVGNIGEEDGLTVVAYEDYCNLKHQSDALRKQIKREKELRQIAEKKLEEVQAEKLALEKEIADFKARRTSTRWKHSTVEFCRRSF